MTGLTTALVLAVVLATYLMVANSPASAARYKVGCIAPNGQWCRIFCQSNRGVACYASAINGRCVKTCRYN